jgi:hypothetical protein
MSHEAEDEGTPQHRGKRSLVLLTAKVRTPDGVIDVRLRNLSQQGALLEAAKPPKVGAEVVFERGETIVKARVAWQVENRFGLQFFDPIEEHEVLVHVGRTRAATPEPANIRRSGFRGTPSLSPQQREAAEAWFHGSGRPLGE